MTLLFFKIVLSLFVVANEPQTFYVETTDGIKLSTDVYLPEESGTFPAVLYRTYLKKQGFDIFLMETILKKKGWALVVQNGRGCYDSSGEKELFIHDASDGALTVDWIKKQPWFNGKLGGFGASAMGILQYLLATEADSIMKCQMVIISTPDFYHHAVYWGGVLRYGLVSSWLKLENKLDEMDVIRQHPTYDDYYKQIDITSKYGSIKVADLHMGGWYDIFLQGTIDAFNGFATSPDENAHNRQRLLIGPWTHYNIGTSYAGSVKYPDNAILNAFELLPAYFDYCLYDAENEYTGTKPVKYYVMGDVKNSDAPGNFWREDTQFPPESEIFPLYLTKNNGLSWDQPDAGKNQWYELYSDPANPVPTIGGGNLDLPPGPKDQKEIESRDDVLVFSTPVLEHPVELTGRIKVVLYVSTDAVDTDFAVRLTDVYPDGISRLVQDGIHRLSYRDSDTNPEKAEKDTIYKLEIDLWSTSLIFNTGHKIRIIVSGSNYPRFDVSSNTGIETFGGDATPVIAHDKIYFGADYPSHIIVPVPLVAKYKPNQVIEDAEESEEIVEGYENNEEVFEAIDEIAQKDAYFETYSNDVAQVDTNEQDIHNTKEIKQIDTKSQRDVLEQTSKSYSSSNGCSLSGFNNRNQLIKLLMLLTLLLNFIFIKSLKRN